MDVERTLLKIAVSVIALFAIFQGTQGLKGYSLQRSAEIAHKANLSNDEKNSKKLEQIKFDSYLNNLLSKESEKRRKE